MQEIEKITYSTEWYDTLVSDCKTIIDKAKTDIGVRLLRAKWNLGDKIVPNYNRFERAEYGNKTQKDFAKELELKQQEISNVIRFRKKIGDNFDLWLESTDISVLSWYNIVHGWLPKKKRNHPQIIEFSITPKFSDNVIQTDIQNGLDYVSENSVDLILTDPPYAEASLDLWSELGKFAAYSLKPSKLLVSYSGKAFLPEVYKRLSEHLQYIWTIALVHTDNKRTCYHALHIFERWKPILIFAKPPFTPNEYFEDVVKGAGREKELHAHAQAETEAEHIITQFTKENHFVIDPFCGSGTVLVAAHKLNRKFLGFDIDAEAIKTSLWRLQNEKNL